MKRLFWITVVLILVSMLLSHATAGEPPRDRDPRAYARGGEPTGGLGLAPAEEPSVVIVGENVRGNLRCRRGV